MLKKRPVYTIADNLMAGLALDVTVAKPVSTCAAHTAANSFKLADKEHLRREAYTTGIFLELRVIEALPLRQGPGPAITLVRLVLGVLVGLLVFNA
jgi:hypothetical protein